MTIRGHGSPARLQPVLWSGQRPCFASDAGRQVSAGHAVRRRDGRLFRSLSRGELGEALDPSQIPRIDKAMARRAGIEAELAERLSGHSTRVGAAQDMVAHGIELLAIQQAGRGAAAQLACMQGRDRPVARRGPPDPAGPAAPPAGRRGGGRPCGAAGAAGSGGPGRAAAGRRRHHRAWRAAA